MLNRKLKDAFIKKQDRLVTSENCNVTVAIFYDIHASINNLLVTNKGYLELSFFNAMSHDLRLHLYRATARNLSDLVGNNLRSRIREANSND